MSKPSLRVLHVAESFSQTSETFVYDLVTKLEEKGLENHVLTTERVNADDRPFPRVTVVPFPKETDPKRLLYYAGEKMGLLGKGDSFRQVLRGKFDSAVQDIRPDVVHAQFGPMGVVIEPVATRHNLPLIVSFHGFDVFVLAQKPRWKRMYARLFQKGARFHAVSNYMVERLVQLGASPEDVKLIHNGIGLDSFLGGRLPSREEEGVVQCVHVGRLVEKKAPVHLIRAFHRAQAEVSKEVSLRLKIAGSGPLMEKVEAEIEARHLRGSVQLLGTVRHEQVPVLLRESDIYTQHCMTASDGDEEGMGVTFAEASAAGLPVVATRHDGIPDVVRHGKTGFLVPEGDVETMGLRMAELATDPELRARFGEAGRAHVEENFRLDRQVDKMVDLYEQAYAEC